MSVNKHQQHLNRLSLNITRNINSTNGKIHCIRNYITYLAANFKTSKDGSTKANLSKEDRLCLFVEFDAFH